MKTFVCRLLVLLMIWTPFQAAHAAMLDAGQAIAAQSEAAPAPLSLTRADVAKQLQAFGVPAATAQERVAAMSDAELASLNEHVATLPAGADISWGGVLLVLLIAAAVYWWFFMRDMRR